jgi:hypothetical protein
VPFETYSDWAAKLISNRQAVIEPKNYLLQLGLTEYEGPLWDMLILPESEVKVWYLARVPEGQWVSITSDNEAPP